MLMQPNDKNDFVSAVGEWIKGIIASGLLTMFEPQTESLSSVRIGQARSLSGNLSRMPDDKFYAFPRVYGRHTTLAGIWMFLKKDHSKEYLVTAFGKRKGQRWDRPA